MLNVLADELAGFYHVLGAEYVVEFFFRHEPCFENQVVPAFIVVEGLFRQLGRYFVTEVGVESRNHTYP